MASEPVRFVRRLLQMRSIRLLAVPLVLSGAFYAFARSLDAPRYRGPKTDHFDGREFHNVGPFEERGFGDVLRWKWSSKAVPWPDWVQVPPQEPPPVRQNDGVRVTFVNHATVLIQAAGRNVLTDPVWSDVAGPFSLVGPKRHKAPGIAFDRLPKIDAVLLSHNHYDHLDMPTLRRLAERDAPRIFGGLGTAALLAKHDVHGVTDLDWWQSAELGPNVRLTFAPAQHWCSRSFFDRNVSLWGSFFIALGSQSVYFAGDTGNGPHFAMVRERLGAPSLALLPIGAYEPRWFMHPQHIDPGEAVAAHVTLGADRSVAIHHGTFDQSDEGMDDPSRLLAEELRRRGLSRESFVVLENGASLTLPAPSDAE